MATRTNNISGSFTATGTSDTLQCDAETLGFSLSDTFVGTLKVQRSHDGGVNWNGVETFTGVAEKNYNNVVYQGVPTFLYRIECSAYTSGTLEYFLGV